MVALFIVLASVAFETWPTADDYCNSVLVAQSGVAGALRWLFFEWSGRLVSGVPLYATFAWIDLPALHWVSVALVGLLAVAAYQAATLVAGEDRPLRWPLCAFIFAALVLGLYRLLGQAVLWSTGGIVYSVPLVVALLWFESVRRLSQGRDARGGELYGFILGAMLAGQQHRSDRDQNNDDGQMRLHVELLSAFDGNSCILLQPFASKRRKGESYGRSSDHSQGPFAAISQ